MANEISNETMKDLARGLGLALKEAGVKPGQPTSWNELLIWLEAVERGLELMPGETSNVKHFARIELANSIARAREILEALAQDEDKNEKAE